MSGNMTNVTPWEQCNPWPAALGDILHRGDIGHVALHGDHHLYNVIDSQNSVSIIFTIKHFHALPSLCQEYHHPIYSTLIKKSADFQCQIISKLQLCNTAYFYMFVT